MKMPIVVLRDIKANMYKQVMCVSNVNVFIRDLQDMVNAADGKEDWQRHPEDFELWYIGEFDTDDGQLWTVSEDDEYKRKQLCALSTLKGN